MSKQSKVQILLVALLVVAGAIYAQQVRAVTEAVYPNGDLVRDWTPAPTGCTTTTHFDCIDEPTHSTSDYINTGTALQQVTEEFTMTSVASSNVSITNVAVLINANSVTCNGNAPNCDSLSVNIRMGGVLQTPQTYTPTATSSQTTLNFTTGTPWTSDSDLEVIVTRNPVGGGNANNADDDMLLTGLKADITYTNNASFSMSAYRVFENDNSSTASDDFTKLTNPTTLPTGTSEGVAYSSDGTYMSVAHATSPFITIYKRSGDTFTKLADPATLPAGTGKDSAFSPDGVYLSVAHTTSPFITIYKRSGDTFTKLADPATLPAGTGMGVSFSSDGIYLSVTHVNSPFITIYKRSGDTFTKLADPATLPAGNPDGTAFSPDDVYLSVAHATSPFITIYKRSGDTFTKLTNPATLPTGSGYDTAYSSDGTYMSVAHATSPFITIYKRSGDTFTKLADPSEPPPFTGNGTAFSPDGAYLSVAHVTSPYVTIYKRSGDTFTKLADPATLPTGMGLNTAFSPDGTYMSVAHVTSPNITIYKRAVTANVGTPITTTNSAASIGKGVPFRLRLNLHVSNGEAEPGKSFKLQFAPKSGTCDTAHSGELFTDVTSSSSIKYYDNSNLSDMSGITEAAGSGDPTHGSDSLVRQTYEELNAFDVSAAIPVGSDGLWDFSLSSEPTASLGSYCLRAVEAVTGTPLSTPSVVPEITLAAPSVSQANYRWFAGANSISPGAPLAAQDSAGSIPINTSFRLRQRLAVDNVSLTSGARQLKLQYAEKSGVCDTTFSGETYADVSSESSTSELEYPSAFSLNSGPDNDWQNPTNLYAVDNNTAQLSGTSFGVSDPILLKGFNFNVPTNAVITGFTVNLVNISSAINILDNEVYLSKDGLTPLGDNQASGLTPQSSYGEQSGLWGSTWTPEEVNSSEFGVYLKFEGLDFDMSLVVDAINIDVSYTVPQDSTIFGYHDNSSATNGTTIVSSGNDPVNGARSTIMQTYLESDPFNNTAAISAGSDGLWDFSLNPKAASAGKTYCFRVVTSNGTPLDSYSHIPEIVVSNGSLTLQQQTRGGGGVLNGIKSKLNW